MKITLTIIGTICILLVGCSDEPFNCHCETSSIHENDSILGLPELDTMMYRLSEKFNQPQINSLNTETYRFSKRGTCSGKSVFYQLTRTKSGAVLTYKSYLGPNNRSTGHNIIEEKKYTLDEMEWIDFKKSIDTNCFWTMAIDQGNDPFFGGTTWMLEGFQPNKQNCANRDAQIVLGWLPDSSAFTNLCYKIMSYSEKK